MSRWFRSYADTHRNPKVAKLTDRQFRLWHNLMCVAAENDGLIPPMDDLKHVLNARLDHLSTGVERLISGGLIDRLEVGYEPHNWNKRQYKSDTSTDRVQKFREKRNVSETPPETEAETEAEPEKKDAQKFALPDDIPPEPFAQFVAMRKKIRKEMSDHAKHLAVLKLRRMRDEDGWEPEDVLNHCTLNSYQGLYPPTKQGGNNDRNTSRNAEAAELAFGPASGWTDERTF